MRQNSGVDKVCQIDEERQPHLGQEEYVVRQVLEDMIGLRNMSHKRHTRLDTWWELKSRFLLNETRNIALWGRRRDEMDIKISEYLVISHLRIFSEFLPSMSHVEEQKDFANQRDGF